MVMTDENIPRPENKVVAIVDFTIDDIIYSLSDHKNQQKSNKIRIFIY